MKRAVFALLGFLLVTASGLAASAPLRGPVRRDALDRVFPWTDSRVHTEGKAWVTVTNYGVFGNEGPGQSGSLSLPCPPYDWAPQGEYPGGSDQQYLYMGALWIGAQIWEDTAWVPRVSVGFDGWFDVKEIFPGGEDSDRIHERSNIPDHVNCLGEAIYDPEADANEEFMAVYSDTLTDQFFVPEDPEDGAHRPLGLEVTQRSMAWNSQAFDDFIIVEFTARNISADTLRNAYLGLYVDGDVGLGHEMDHQTDDITGFLGVDTLTGDTFNIGYIADNDGRAPGNWGGPLIYPHVSGMYVLATSQQDLKWSYNWWVSNGEVGIDFGPAWESYCARDSLGMDWTSQYGTPVGDEHKYHLLSNGEHDYDQILTNRLADVLPQHVVLPDGSETDETWCTVDPSDDQDDIANGYDTRFLMSCGPLGELDHIEPNGERIYRLSPGGAFTITVAYVFGEYFHNPLNPQSDPEQIDPSLFDFTTLLSNARHARMLFESTYSYQPPTYPPNWHPTGTLSHAVPFAWNVPQVGSVQGYNVFGIEQNEANEQIRFNGDLITSTSYIVDGVVNGAEWIFRIETVDDSGMVSGYADTLVRVGAPLPITGLNASLDSSVVQLSWNASNDPNLTNYRVLRRSAVLGDSISDLATGTTYTDVTAVIGRVYTYWVIGENSLGLTSYAVDSVTMIPWDPDRRILVIDETDSVNALGMLRGAFNDDSVRAMYQRLMDATGEEYDLIEQPRSPELIYSLESMAPYDLVIWNCENTLMIGDANTIPERQAIFRNYVNAGGKLLRVTRRYLTARLLTPAGVLPGSYLEDSPLGDLLSPLSFDSVYAAPGFALNNYSMQFIGANSDDATFPSFVLDTAKVHELNWLNHQLDYLPEIDVFWPRPQTWALYHSMVLPTDTSGLANQPVAVIGYNQILMGFPLYALYEQDAQTVLNASINALRTYNFEVPDEPTPTIPTTIALQQNYPNPFNATTTLRFDLPNFERVQLIIYNLLGQEVRTLIDQPLNAGSHVVAWDGTGASGLSLSSGIYLARLKTSHSAQTMKLVLLR